MSNIIVCFCSPQEKFKGKSCVWRHERERKGDGGEGGRIGKGDRGKEGRRDAVCVCMTYRRPGFKCVVK